jgi:MFS family permease
MSWDISWQLMLFQVIKTQVTRNRKLINQGLLTSVIYGFLSDRYGRRPILILACIGEALGLIWVLLLCII